MSSFINCEIGLDKFFFVGICRSDHPETIFNSMATIMTLVLNESEEISVDLLSSILAVLKIENKACYHLVP